MGGFEKIRTYFGLEKTSVITDGPLPSLRYFKKTLWALTVFQRVRLEEILW